MKRENIALAKLVLEGETLEAAGREFGQTRGRAWQIVRAFCLEYMFSHERLDDDGKLKNLNDLRKSWQSWTQN